MTTAVVLSLIGNVTQSKMPGYDVPSGSRVQARLSWYAADPLAVIVELSSPRSETPFEFTVALECLKSPEDGVGHVRVVRALLSYHVTCVGAHPQDVVTVEFTRPRVHSFLQRVQEQKDKAVSVGDALDEFLAEVLNNGL